jgi:hypothetical protein
MADDKNTEPRLSPEEMTAAVEAAADTAIAWAVGTPEDEDGN